MPSTEVVAMLFIQLLTLLSTEKSRRPKIGTNDVIKFLVDGLRQAIRDHNDMYLERALCLLRNLTLENEEVVRILSQKDSPLYFFETLIDLLDSTNLRIKTLAAATVQNFIQPTKGDLSGKALYVKANHSLFCHKHGLTSVLRYLSSANDSDPAAAEFIVAALRLMIALTSPNGFGTDIVLKRIVVASGALQVLYQCISSTNEKIKDYSIYLLYALSTAIRKI